VTRARLALAGCAVLLVGGAGDGAAPTSAVAASGPCSGAGVTVVVDFGALGGGIQQRCATGGGSRTAYDAFRAAGVSLTEVQRFPGAICQVEDRPQTQCQTMPPADAYWGLFSSQGSGWTFSSRGVTSLRVSSGDTVAFAWQASRSVRRPGIAPAPAAAAQPSSSPTAAKTRHHGTTGASRPPASSVPSATPSASSASSASVTASPHPARSRRPVAGGAVRTTGHSCAGTGVDVVVDFHQLPGGIRLGCAADGAGGSAWDAFGGAGIRLTELAAFAGGICRVDGRPSSAACTAMPPADAYWSLYVRNGSTSAYAAKGARQLKVADGEVVALSWQQGSKPAPPRLSPAQVVAATPSATPSAGAADPVTSAATSDEADSSSGGGLPWEVPVGVVVLLAIGGATGVALRRRAGSAGR
jgi:hypothetical protein